MYRLAMCGLLLDDDSSLDKMKYDFMHGLFSIFDLTRCIKMAIVHDLAESYVGDITPHDGKTMESSALKITNMLRHF
jgi:putative hydrolase of HD superfamily